MVSTPQYQEHHLILDDTDALVVPVGTTGERPTPAAGMFRYNTTEGKFEGYTTEWGEIGGGGGLTTAAHVANNATVTLDLTAAQDHKITATGACTITCSGGTEATSHTIRIINSGSATVGFSTYFLFPSGNTPVVTINRWSNQSRIVYSKPSRSSRNATTCGCFTQLQLD